MADSCCVGVVLQQPGWQKANCSQRIDLGAVNHLRADAVSQCCEREGQCFDAPTSCFCAVYLEKTLGSPGIPTSSARADVSGTQGAVLCAESQCLSRGPPPVCRWPSMGCL